MRYFNPKDLDYFRSLLEQHRTVLLNAENSGKQAAETVELDQARMGRLSRMDALQNQAISQEANRHRALELKRIQGALQRVANEEYGYCVSCDAAIAFRRLEIDPATPLCVTCAEKNSP